MSRYARMTNYGCAFSTLRLKHVWLAESHDIDDKIFRSLVTELVFRLAREALALPDVRRRHGVNTGYRPVLAQASRHSPAQPTCPRRRSRWHGWGDCPQAACNRESDPGHTPFGTLTAAGCTPGHISVRCSRVAQGSPAALIPPCPIASARCAAYGGAHIQVDSVESESSSLDKPGQRMRIAPLVRQI